MKLQTAILIFSAFMSLGTATPVAATNDVDHFSSLKRDVDGNTPYEKVSYHLNFIMKELRGLLRDDYFDVSKFGEKKEELFEDITWTQQLAETELPQGAWKSEVNVVRGFLENTLEVVENQESLSKCNYWGSDLVKQIGLLNIKLSALYVVNDEPSGKEYQTKIASYEHDFRVLEDRANKDTNMSDGVRRMFDRQKKNAQASIQRLRNSEEDNEDERKEAQNLTCPAI